MLTVKFAEPEDGKSPGEQAAELHDDAGRLWGPIEGIIDGLKRARGQARSARDRETADNALENVREWLGQLSRR